MSEKYVHFYCSDPLLVIKNLATTEYNVYEFYKKPQDMSKNLPYLPPTAYNEDGHKLSSDAILKGEFFARLHPNFMVIY